MESIMDTNKLNPWNWLKKEDEEIATLPTKQRKSGQQDSPMPSSLRSLHDEIDRLFDKAFHGINFPSSLFDKESFSMLKEGTLKPNVDISGTDTEYTITAELPGMTDEDISIELKGDALVLKGEKRQEKKSEEEGYYRVERSYGSFLRVLNIPQDADAEGIKAKYENGVLAITLPRKVEAIPETKKISIEQQ
jgi:HSP20 family protein